MAANQPASGRDIIKAGTDVRAIRKPINEAFRSVPREFITTGSASYVDGGRVSLASLGPDAFWLRLNSKDTGNTPIRYGWTQVWHNRTNGTWANLSVSGNSTDDGHAIELNNANLTVGSATRYPARLDPQSGRVTFFQGNGGSGGTVNATSTETVLMILGDYASYKDCPNVPGSPPTVITDVCNGTRGTELCVPAYAYAVYQRCGYKWNKVGDTRTYQVWANEMNGGTFSAWRRFVIPRWGGNLTATGPDPDDDCIGVAFLGTGAGSALTCSCPTCLSSPPEGVTLCLKFRTIPRPADPKECGTLKTEMDANSAWDKDYVLTLTKILGGYCSTSVSSDDGIFTFNWDWQDGSQLECDWGPDEYDPCDPCEHWGRLYASIEVPGGNEPNCGSVGHWTGEFKGRDVCNLLCDCGTGPVTPLVQVFCGGCGNNQVPPAVWNVIQEGSIELTCCFSEIADTGGELTGTVQDLGGGLDIQDQTL